MPDLSEVAGNHTIECRIPAVAGSTVDKVCVGVAPFNCTVTAVNVNHDAAITGVATNNFKGALVNGGQTGTGTTEVASKTYSAGGNGLAFSDSLTLSTTTANLNLAKGDKFLYEKTVNGTGLTDPAKLVRITFTSRGG